MIGVLCMFYSRARHSLTSHILTTAFWHNITKNLFGKCMKTLLLPQGPFCQSITSGSCYYLTIHIDLAPPAKLVILWQVTIWHISGEHLAKISSRSEDMAGEGMPCSRFTHLAGKCEAKKQNRNEWAHHIKVKTKATGASTNWITIRTLHSSFSYRFPFA